MPFALIFQVVLLPQGELRDPGTRVCVLRRDRKSEQQKEDGMRWLHSKPLQCPAQSDQNPVLEDPPTQIRFPTKQLTKVGGSGKCGRISPLWNGLAELTNAFLLNRVELRKKRLSRMKKTKEKAKCLSKIKEIFFTLLCTVI